MNRGEQGNENPNNAEITELIEQCQQGDLGAFNELLKLYRTKAYGLAFSFLKNHHDAEDISQEAFLKAYKNLKTFDLSGSFESWLFTIVANLARNKIRWNGVRKRFTFSLDQNFDRDDEEGSQVFQIPEQAPNDNPSIYVDRLWESKKIAEAMANLSEQQRAALHLKFILGCKISEIARVMNLAEGTVKTHIFRGVESLKKSFVEENQSNAV